MLVGSGTPEKSGVWNKNNLSPTISTHLATSSPDLPSSPFATCFCHSSSVSLGSSLVPLGFIQIHKLPL